MESNAQNVTPSTSSGGAANRSRMYYRKGVWKLLGICGEQASFDKHDLRWYQAPATASKKGYAVRGQWKEVILPRINLQVALGIAKRPVPSSVDKGGQTETRN